MLKFIKLTFQFIVLTIGLLVLIDFSTASIERRFADFKIESQPRYIVVGHSFPECAYNDSLITDFKNFSHSGDSYFYTYLKTKELVSQNPSIEIVFVEFTNNQIVEEMNNWIWGNMFLSRGYTTYGAFMSWSDKLMLFKNNNSDYFNASSVSLKKRSARILKKDFNFINRIGGYLYLEKELTQGKIINPKNQNAEIVLKFNLLSHQNLVYLDKIISLCKENKKRVVLIRSPLHKYYKGFTNEKLYQDILNSRYSNLEYLDFSKFPLSNSQFADLEHLNFKGAKAYSTWFNTMLINGLLEKEDMQDYINESIKNEIAIN